MDYTQKSLEVIQKVKITATEVQENLYFLEDFQKIKGTFYEIKISSRVSIFVENELAQQNVALRDALYFRKNFIFFRSCCFISM